MSLILINRRIKPHIRHVMTSIFTFDVMTDRNQITTKSSCVDCSTDTASCSDCVSRPHCGYCYTSNTCNVFDCVGNSSSSTTGTVSVRTILIHHENSDSPSCSWNRKLFLDHRIVHLYRSTSKKSSQKLN